MSTLLDHEPVLGVNSLTLPFLIGLFVVSKLEFFHCVSLPRRSELNLVSLRFAMKATFLQLFSKTISSSRCSVNFPVIKEYSFYPCIGPGDACVRMFGTFFRVSVGCLEIYLRCCISAQ